MKKQFLHEDHNRQDRAKKPEYQELIREQGEHYDRGGASKKRLLSFRGASLFIDLRHLLSYDKESLLQNLERHLKFVIAGSTGTVAHLLKDSAVAEQVKERIEKTKCSVLRSDKIAGIAQHPKKNREFPVLEFTCFLQPLEPLPDPIFKKHFAFRAIVAKPRGSTSESH